MGPPVVPGKLPGGFNYQGSYKRTEMELGKERIGTSNKKKKGKAKAHFA
jgi:hypothetical protein